MERVRESRRTLARFRFYDLRQRGWRNLSCLARSTYDSALGVPDPAEAKGNPAEVALAFKDTYRMLNQRIGIFVSLPLRSLDQLSLQKKLREIGRMEGATAKEAEPT